MKKSAKWILMSALILMLSACAGMKNPDMASPEMDAASKRFEPIPGKAKVYIIRPSKFGGKGIDLFPIVNQMMAGSLASGSFLMLEVLPGNYSISAAGNIESPVAVNIPAKAGQLYFVKMYPKVKVGVIVALSPGLHNEIVGTAEGKDLVLNATRYKEMEYRPSRKNLQAGTEKRKLYIIRPKTVRGAASNHKLSPTVDNRVVGSLERGSYLITEVTPGAHNISAAGKYEGECTLLMETSEKKDYFVTVTPKMGFALPKLHLENIGREKGSSMMHGYKHMTGQ